MSRPVLSVKPQNVSLELQNKTVVQKPRIVMVDSGRKTLPALPKVTPTIDQQARYYQNEIRMLNDLIQLRLLELGQDDSIVMEYGQRLARVETRLIPINSELDKIAKEEKAKKNK